MSEFNPVKTILDLQNLDDNDIICGYMAGISGTSEPGSDKSRSFWHGWRNGRVDGGFNEKDEFQSQLAKEYVNQKKYH